MSASRRLKYTSKALLRGLFLVAGIASAADLQSAARQAEASWGVSDVVVSIRFAPLGPCGPLTMTRQLARSTFAERLVELNSACKWSDALLHAVVTHEVGHLLTMEPSHSADPRSIMYTVVRSHGQQITAADREARK